MSQEPADWPELPDNNVAQHPYTLSKYLNRLDDYVDGPCSWRSYKPTGDLYSHDDSHDEILRMTRHTYERLYRESRAYHSLRALLRDTITRLAALLK